MHHKKAASCRHGAKMTAKTALFPGSFDPFTLGHLDVARRVLNIVDRLVIAVGDNGAKYPMLSPEERLEAIKAQFSDEPRVEVARLDSLTPIYMKDHGIDLIVRGLRDGKDFEYEWKLFQMYRTLHPKIDAIYLPAEPTRSFLSSTLAKAAIAGGADPLLYVPKAIAERLALAKKD